MKPCLVAVLALLAGCPPPPATEEPDAGFADAGTIGAAGDECFSPTISNDCESGLECAALLDAVAGTFACVAPATQGGACFFNNNEVDNGPPDDGCGAGLACGGNDACVQPGVLGAPCQSPTDCESLNCGSLADGTGDVCVINECAGGCPLGTVCQQAGRCGSTCVAPPGAGQPCVVTSDGVCSPVRSSCAAPLECFRGDAANTTCDTPGDEDSACSLETQDDGCTAAFKCDGTGRCVER